MIDLNIEQMDTMEIVLKDTPKKIPLAVSRAINRATQTARTEAARKVRQTYRIKHGDVLKTIKISQASPGNLTGTVVSSGNVTPLYKYKVTPKAPSPNRKVSIRASVKKGGGGPIKSAFVARAKSNGYTGVFVRSGKARYPIVQLYGPAIPQAIGNDDVSKWVEEKAQERLEQRLDHEISRALED